MEGLESEPLLSGDFTITQVRVDEVYEQVVFEGVATDEPFDMDGQPPLPIIENYDYEVPKVTFVNSKTLKPVNPKIEEEIVKVDVPVIQIAETTAQYVVDHEVLVQQERVVEVPQVMVISRCQQCKTEAHFIPQLVSKPVSIPVPLIVKVPRVKELEPDVVRVPRFVEVPEVREVDVRKNHVQKVVKIVEEPRMIYYCRTNISQVPRHVPKVREVVRRVPLMKVQHEEVFFDYADSLFDYDHEDLRVEKGLSLETAFGMALEMRECVAIARHRQTDVSHFVKAKTVRTGRNGTGGWEMYDKRVVADAVVTLADLGPEAIQRRLDRAFLLAVSFLHDELCFSPIQTLKNWIGRYHYLGVKPTIERVPLASALIDAYGQTYMKIGRLWFLSAVLFTVCLPPAYTRLELRGTCEEGGKCALVEFMEGPIGFFLGPCFAVAGLLGLALLDKCVSCTASGGRWAQRGRLRRFLRMPAQKLYYGWIRAKTKQMQFNDFMMLVGIPDEKVKLGICFGYVALLLEVALVAVLKKQVVIGVLAAYAMGEFYCSGLNYLLAPPDKVINLVRSELGSQSDFFLRLYDTRSSYFGMSVSDMLWFYKLSTAPGGPGEMSTSILPTPSSMPRLLTDLYISGYHHEISWASLGSLDVSLDKATMAQGVRQLCETFGVPVPGEEAPAPVYQQVMNQAPVCQQIVTQELPSPCQDGLVVEQAYIP